MAKFNSSRESFEAKFVRIPDAGCWLWEFCVNRAGYGIFDFGDERGTRLAHRVAWSLYRGPIPDGLCVLHRCDVRCCVNPSHLFLGTAADNGADMASKGRSTRGTAHPNARLTESEVREILALRRAGVSGVICAARFGVSTKAISKIFLGHRWCHLHR